MAGVLVAAHAHMAEAVQHFLLKQNAVGIDEVLDQLGIVRERRRPLRTRARRGKYDRGAKRRADCDEDANSHSRHIAPSVRQAVSLFLVIFSTGDKMLYVFVNCTKLAAIHLACFSGTGFSLWVLILPRQRLTG